MTNRTCSRSGIAILIALLQTIFSNGQSTDSLVWQLNNDKTMDNARRFELLSKVAANSGSADTILKYSEEAVQIAEKLNINPAPMFIYRGYGYMMSGQLASSLESFMKAANYYKSDHNNIGVATAYNYMSDVYNLQENFSNAKYYLRNAVEIYRQEKDTIRLAYALNNLGYVSYSMQQYDTALVLYSNSGVLYKRLGFTTEYATSLGNSGLVYSRQSKLDEAENNLLMAIKMLVGQEDERALIQYMIEYAGILHRRGDTDKSLVWARQSFDKALKNNILEFERDAAHQLAVLYKDFGKYDSAYYFQSVFVTADDSIKSFQNIQKMADLRTEFEVSRKQAEVDSLEKNKLIQFIVILGLAIIVMLSTGLIIVYSRSLKRSKKLTAALNDRRILLEKQSAELKEQREEIISSITYAKRIQSAVLPPQKYISELFPDSFILYKPKEIVSGDFYWVKQVQSYRIIVAADCTGHGVPGAFMSALGISLLSEIVERREITQTNMVLNELREQIKHSLRQIGDKEEPKDGMDLALCVIDSNNLIQYSGANCPLYIVRNNNGALSVEEIPADPMPVGVHLPEYVSFSNHQIQLNSGDAFYLFSDGYIDQNGGQNNHRFTRSRFRKLIFDIHSHPMALQKTMLEQTLVEWMGEHPQRDDIMVLGVKV